MADKVFVFDTTLRDGEQAAGSRLGARQKLELARQLELLAVDVIEAGFPISSPEDFEAVRLISQEIRGPAICGLTRAVPKDVEVCGQALVGARRSRIHTGIGVSDIHILGKFGDEKYGRSMAEKRKTLIDMAAKAVAMACGLATEVEFYAEDAGRADEDYLIEMLEAVVDAGATILNIPDTTGYSLPEIWGELIRKVASNPRLTAKAVISVHCHNDLGLAVANSLAGVAAGARQVECTINGIGERAGNAALEEVVMALRTRRDHYGVETGINTKELYRTSRMVADSLGFAVPHNKAVVGDNAFRHSSGIHVDGFLKKRETYEIMTPEDVGVLSSKVVLTARTGRHGVRHRLEVLGHHLTGEEIERVYQRFLIVADKKREVFDEDLDAIVHDEMRPVKATFELVYLHTSSGTGTIPTATVRLKMGDETRSGAECGDGPVDATYKALAKLAGVEATLVSYDIRAVTGGAEAMGEVTVRLERKSVRVFGKGVSTDVIEASARAFVDGLNKLVAASPEGAALPEAEV
jgi:2-isopropylmalate synthase